MKAFSVISLVILVWAKLTESSVIPQSAEIHGPEANASAQITRWQEKYERSVWEALEGRTSGCTRENIVYRQRWGAMSKKDRIAYTDAVQCLQRLPSISDPTTVPGARTHFDDFVAVHIENSAKIHFSGIFFQFHRYFTWLYEQNLRNKCGYKGTQPYWDWTLTYKDPAKSAVFDGSSASMGSNGVTIPHGPLNVTAFGISYEDPPGTGGGCVFSGPFTNMTVNLGPVTYAPLVGNGNGLAYNPRCLKRDLNLYWANQTKPTDVVRLISSCTDLGCFDGLFEALNGVHAGGHFTIGGDPGTDPYVSPGDPAFYLHHSQVDRIWTLWQYMDPAERIEQVYGTSTTFNVPPSPNVTLDTFIDFGVLDKSQQVKNLVSSIDGPFCYMYI